MEGVMRYKVRLLPHSPQWAAEYRQVKAAIETAWGANLLAIQHVGSTAIPAIHAKPILDVAVRLHAIERMDVQALTELGYDYCGPQQGNASYHLFVLRGPGQISLRHIHCYDAEDPGFAQLVGFRDYLNSHPQAALQYQRLKGQLARQYPDDRVAYTAGKAAFIEDIYKQLGL